MTKKTTAKGKSAKTADTTESHDFQAEVSKLLHLMVHSVYSETEVFLRELISNAADACDKLRYAAITEPDLLGADADLKITLTANGAAKELLVSDNGIGMSHDELVENLGTIARSGTEAFVKQLSEKDADVQQIGRFGVGFYSAFMVAGEVEVLSRRAGAEEAWKWVSAGTGQFTLTPLSAEDPAAPARGTQIRLKLRDDAEEYLEPGRIETIVRTYSDHISFPIELHVEDGDDAPEPRQLNSASALWSRPKSEISEEQYKEFYGHVGGMFDDPALTLHYKAEGRHEYTVLVFVPTQKPFNLFDPERKAKLKLYVRRVFISDDADMLPGYLRFVRGVIDSEDMPLNISREMLQNNPIVASIRGAVTKRILSELEKTAEKKPEAYDTFWSEFGVVLKEGLYEDMERRDQLLALTRFRTTVSGDDLRSLKDYAAAMKENQTAIYYVTGEDRTKAMASPQLEGFRAKGIEVLLLSDPVDNFWITSVLGHDGKPFTSVTQGAADLDAIDAGATEDAEPEADASELGTLIAVIKQALGEDVSDVRRTDRLTDSAACLVADAGALDRNLEKLLAQHNPDGIESKAPILEINPRHEMVKTLAHAAKASGTSGDLEDAARLLLDQAYILEGEPVRDPAAFAARMSRFMTMGLSTDS
jgi:molecular chaperone HtpG